MPSPSDPLLLWCSSHESLAAEEIPLFLEAGLNTYSKIADAYGAPPALVYGLPNFIWCPILSTLQEPEDEQLVRNTQPLRAFVTPARLGADRWSPEASEPYVVDTIPRLHTDFYLGNYRRFIAEHGDLPLKILGGNEPRGGPLDDPRIVGRLPAAWPVAR